MPDKFYNALFANGGILAFDEDYNKVLFNVNQRPILDVFLILIKLILMKTIILMKMILILLFRSDAWLDIANLKNAKHLKKIKKELLPIAWHP